MERVDRVYVPLRGVFERLGASVVYEGGKITATRGSTTVALQIGSNSSIVNGATVALDSPPFLIGARTPPNGAAVPNTFTVQGFTRPGARVHIVATASALVGFATVNENTVTADALADANGHFARTISAFDAGAGVIDVRLESRAPDGGIAVRTLRLRPRR